MDVAANWKLAMENFCESYHLPWIHPSLNKRSRLEDHYHIFGDDLFVGQGSTVYDPDYLDGERFPSFETWPSDKRTCAEYVALFPNAWIGLHVDHLFTAILSPAAKDRTVESFQFYYLGDATGERVPQGPFPLRQQARHEPRSLARGVRRRHRRCRRPANRTTVTGLPGRGILARDG